MNPFLIVVLIIAGLFILLEIVALIKRPSSRYKDKPSEQNPMEGRTVRFVENTSEPENADGVRGHLEATGTAHHKAGFYEIIIKRLLDIILSFFGLVILSPIFLVLSLWIVIDDPGPILFTQKRIGRNKQYFLAHSNYLSPKYLDVGNLLVA